MIAKTDFFRKFGERIVPVVTDNVETGDFMLFHPEEKYKALNFINEGYEVASVYETNTEDVVSIDNDISEHPFKIGYLVLKKEL